MAGTRLWVQALFLVQLIALTMIALWIECSSRWMDVDSYGTTALESHPVCSYVQRWPYNKRLAVLRSAVTAVSPVKVEVEIIGEKDGPSRLEATWDTTGVRVRVSTNQATHLDFDAALRSWLAETSVRPKRWRVTALYEEGSGSILPKGMPTTIATSSTLTPQLVKAVDDRIRRRRGQSVRTAVEFSSGLVRHEAWVLAEDSPQTIEEEEEFPRGKPHGRIRVVTEGDVSHWFRRRSFGTNFECIVVPSNRTFVLQGNTKRRRRDQSGAVHVRSKELGSSYVVPNVGVLSFVNLLDEDVGNDVPPEAFDEALDICMSQWQGPLPLFERSKNTVVMDLGGIERFHISPKIGGLLRYRQVLSDLQDLITLLSDRPRIRVTDEVIGLLEECWEHLQRAASLQNTLTSEREREREREREPYLEQMFQTQTETAREALRNAKHHPTLMEPFEFSTEYVFAIFSPVLLPLALPMLLGTYREWKRYREKTRPGKV